MSDNTSQRQAQMDNLGQAENSVLLHSDVLQDKEEDDGEEEEEGTHDEPDVKEGVHDRLHHLRDSLLALKGHLDRHVRATTELLVTTRRKQEWQWTTLEQRKKEVKKLESEEVYRIFKVGKAVKAIEERLRKVGGKVDLESEAFSENEYVQQTYKNQRKIMVF